jgi:hypothetical protein
MPINTNIYKVNWFKLVSWLLPSDLFMPKTFALCKALATPIATLHTNFLAYRKQCLYDLTITPQICWLVKLLNDKFDYVQRRIYISEGERGDNIYLFQDAEDGNEYLFQNAEVEQIWLFNDSEVGNNPAHFVVYIPASVASKIDVLKSILNIYKLPSRRYQIQTF